MFVWVSEQDVLLVMDVRIPAIGRYAIVLVVSYTPPQFLRFFRVSCRKVLAGHRIRIRISRTEQASSPLRLHSRRPSCLVLTLFLVSGREEV